jgi:hypothetical protein
MQRNINLENSLAHFRVAARYSIGKTSSANIGRKNMETVLNRLTLAQAGQEGARIKMAILDRMVSPEAKILR